MTATTKVNTYTAICNLSTQYELFNFNIQFNNKTVYLKFCNIVTSVTHFHVYYLLSHDYHTLLHISPNKSSLSLGCQSFSDYLSCIGDKLVVKSPVSICFMIVGYPPYVFVTAFDWLQRLNHCE